MDRRKDNRGRVLNNGEIQRSDGKYAFQYTNRSGKRKSVYSWKLILSDKTPTGKRTDLSLREKEKMLAIDIADGITVNSCDYSVLEIVEKYISQKNGVKHSTRAGYKTVVNLLKKDDFGAKKIDRVKLSDAKSWLIKLQQTDGKSYSTIHTIRGVLKPAFQMVVDDDLLRKNPFVFQLVTVIVNDSVTREALTHDEKRKLLDFVKNDNHFSKYYEAIYILFFTGMRISEFCGLTLKDLDMKEKTININHQLQRTSQMQYVIESTKTDAGIRIIPMQEEVCECFRRIIANRKEPKVEPLIDGKMGFLYLDKNGMPMVALHWEKYFQHICEKYNKIYKVQMPKVTPHVCRHTYCSHLASSGMNPKHLQYLMGHSDIGVTLNTYTHIEFDNVKKEVKNFEKCVM